MRLRIILVLPLLLLDCPQVYEISLRSCTLIRRIEKTAKKMKTMMTATMFLM
jgi:hypothetical protein